MKGRQSELKGTKKYGVLSRSALSLPLEDFEKKYMRGRAYATKQRYSRAWVQFQKAKGFKFPTAESRYIPRDMTYRLERGLTAEYLTRVKIKARIPDGSETTFYRYIAHSDVMTDEQLADIIYGWEFDYDLEILSFRRTGGYRHTGVDKMGADILAQGLPY